MGSDRIYHDQAAYERRGDSIRDIGDVQAWLLYQYLAR